MERLTGRVVLIEFWDFCRCNSMRTLPYVREWHRRYAEQGLTVIGVHSAGFAPSAEPDAVRAAVARLGIEHPVAIDSEHMIWTDYENAGWPARYVWDQRGGLFEYHYGEGCYDETELAIGELLGLEVTPVAPLRGEDTPGAVLEPQTEDQPGAYSGPYEAGGVWAVLEGAGNVSVNGVEVAVAYPGAYPLIEHERHTVGTLHLELGEGVTCHATCFTPGLA